MEALKINWEGSEHPTYAHASQVVSFLRTCRLKFLGSFFISCTPARNSANFKLFHFIATLISSSSIREHKLHLSPCRSQESVRKVSKVLLDTFLE
jgi:hypothetical protein